MDLMLLLVPLDDTVVFPTMDVTLPVDVAGEERVLLVPRHDGEFAKVGTIADVRDVVRLPGGARGAALLAGLLDQLDRVTQARRERLGLAAGVVPGVVWLALFAGAVLTIAFTFFFGTANLRAQAWMAAMLTLMISMSLLIVMLLDHPFAGDVRVTAAALERVLEDFGGGPSSGSGAQ